VIVQVKTLVEVNGNADTVLEFYKNSFKDTVEETVFHSEQHSFVSAKFEDYPEEGKKVLVFDYEVPDGSVIETGGTPAFVCQSIACQ
jgi:uncharacterized glyoxalase superfamily protein PhnB